MNVVVNKITKIPSESSLSAKQSIKTKITIILKAQRNRQIKQKMMQLVKLARELGGISQAEDWISEFKKLEFDDSQSIRDWIVGLKNARLIDAMTPLYIICPRCSRNQAARITKKVKERDERHMMCWRAETISDWLRSDKAADKVIFKLSKRLRTTCVGHYDLKIVFQEVANDLYNEARVR